MFEWLWYDCCLSKRLTFYLHTKIGDSIFSFVYLFHKYWHFICIRILATVISKTSIKRSSKASLWFFIFHTKIGHRHIEKSIRKTLKRDLLTWFCILIRRLATVISKKSIQETLKRDLMTWFFILIWRLATVISKKLIHETLKRDVLTLYSHTKIATIIFKKFIQETL